MSTPPVPRVERTSEADRVRAVIQDWMAAPAEHSHFTLLGISGYGGVGKSYLLDGVLREFKLEQQDVIVVRVDGSNQDLLTAFIPMVDQKLAPRTLQFKGSLASDDQFPQTRKLIDHQHRLETEVDAEVDKGIGSNDLKAATKALYRFTPFVSKIPSIGPALGALLQAGEKYKVEEYIDPARELLTNLPALNPQKGWLGSYLGRSLEERLADDPYEAIAEAYVADVRARVVGYPPSDFFKLLHRKAEGINRFLLILDDYEAISSVLGEFVVAHLFRFFIEAPFPILVIIAGRGELRDTHTEFSKSLAPFIRDQIKLQPFTPEEGITFLQRAGYDAEEAKRLYDQANGFPFVLSLLADFKSNHGERSVLFYQRFYDRTTQWMNDQQKIWLINLCYLDEVNQETIAAMMPQANPAHVMAWFRHEDSVRDTKHTKYRVDPFISEMLRQYHENEAGRGSHREYLERGRRAMDRGHRAETGTAPPSSPANSPLYPPQPLG